MFKSFEGKDGWYGVCDEHGAVLYEADTFDTKREADLYADAHNNGARSYNEAAAMIEGIDEGEAVEHSVQRTPEQLDRLHENLDEIIEVGAGGE